MKKITGNYTTDAGKALKNSDRLQCRINEDGEIFLCSGFVLFRMTPAEYAATVQPVTRCDAGNWIMELGKGEKREAGPTDPDIIKMFWETVNTHSENTLEKCPMEIPLNNKTTLIGYYSPAADFASFYNRLYISALAPGLTIKASRAISPAVVYLGEWAIALVLPYNHKNEADRRAVKAYFTEQTDENRKEDKRHKDQILAYEQERGRLLDQIAAQAAEIEKLQAKLTAAQNAEQPAPVEQPAPADTKTAAQVIASRFAGMDGVQVIIKGKKTTAPVVWLAGDTEKHADAIRAAGAKWSGKRGAYYVRVAA